MIYLLNPGLAPSTRIRRFWLHPGEPVAITRDVVMTLFIDREDEEWMPMLELRAADEALQLRVPAEAYIDLSTWSRCRVDYSVLFLVPLAIEVADDHKPSRLMVELAGVPNRAQFLRP